MKRVGVLLIFIVGISGAAAAHDRDRSDRVAHKGCSAVEVTAPGLRKQPRDGRYSTRKILDLEFETRFVRPVYGEHVLTFKVFTPSGFLYQELDVPFVWPKPRRGKHDRFEPNAEPAANVSLPPGLPVQVLGETHRGRTRDAVQGRLPVAGTSITMSTLYGRWTVQAFLDDRTRPCSPRRSFTIHGQ